MKNRLINIYSWLKHKQSKIALIIILVSVAWTNLNLADWNNPTRVIFYDIKVYYAYLPAAIIHGDLDFEFASQNHKKYSSKLYLGGGPDNKTLLQFTYGMALMYSPFFLVAHAITSHMEIPYVGYQADGYTVPYRIALIISGLAYLALGLYFLRKTLLRYFSESVTAITLLAVALGTNIFYYATTEVTMSHVYSFSLIAVFIYYAVRWSEKPDIKSTLVLGLLTGVITLIRPNNAIIVLFLLFYGVTNWKSLYNRLSQLLRSYWHISLMIIVFLLIWVPQFLYWKHVTGEYFFYSYKDQTFFFDNPQVLYSLFSFRKGLLVYIPILVFAFLGLPFMYKRCRELFTPTLFFTIINIYILSSWCFWWFGGSYGPRSYIDSYIILAFPFAAFTSLVLDRKWYIKVPCVLVLVTLIVHGLFQTLQYRYGAIHYIAMTKEAYRDSFLRLHPSKEYKRLLLFPNYDEARKGIYYQNDLTYEEMYPDRKLD